MFKKYFDTFIISILVFDIARGSILSSTTTELLLCILFLVKLNLANKSIDNKIIYIAITWFLLNIFSSIFTGCELNIIRVTKLFVILLLLPYVLLKFYGISFWIKFEKIIFVLTLISLPLFILNNVIPDFFNNLAIYFRPLTNFSYYKFNNYTTYWSAFLYTNAIESDYPIGGIEMLRNSGFMWEPGAFAMMIVWAIIYNYLTKPDQNIKRNIVYFLALITTQSTAGYLAGLFIIFAFFIKKASTKNIFILFILFIIIIAYVYKLEFVSGKINTYIESFKANELHYNEFYKAVKVDRFMIFYYDMIEVIKYPFGYGSVKDFEIIGVNGISSIIKMWGIPISIYIFILVRKYISIFNYNKDKKLFKSALLISLLIVFFSNPIDRNIFIYLILITPLLFKIKYVNTT